MPLSDFLFNAIILFLGGVLSFMTWTYVSKSIYFALCVLTFMSGFKLAYLWGLQQDPEQNWVDFSLEKLETILKNWKLSWKIGK